MKFRGGVEGLEGLQRGLARIADPARLKESIADAADAVRGAAQANLQNEQASGVRQGGLADSVSINHSADGLSVTVGTTAMHGWHLEFGRIGRPAAPWLEPALDAARPGILARIRQIFAR